MARAKKQFILASDAVRAWIDGSCVMDPKGFIGRSELFSVYQFQTALDGSKQLSSREFYNRIEQIADITPRKRQGIRGFVGVRLKDKDKVEGGATVKAPTGRANA